MPTLEYTIRVEPWEGNPTEDPDNPGQPLPEGHPEFRHQLTIKHKDPTLETNKLTSQMIDIMVRSHDRFGQYGKAVGYDRTMSVVPTDPADRVAQ